jgi:lysophospholipase L1-like esterase
MGSSSIRGWHETIHDDLAPLTIIARGFGGSNMNDALYYADRIILPHKPRAVVIYEGDNDIAQGIPPRKIIESFTEVINKIHRQLPQCRIYFLSIKPSASRWNMWPKMVQTNKLIAEKCANDGRLIFVDVSTAMLNEDGEPRDEIFLSDELHVNSVGYEIWANILKPILLESELQYE